MIYLIWIYQINIIDLKWGIMNSIYDIKYDYDKKERGVNCKL